MARRKVRLALAGPLEAEALVRRLIPDVSVAEEAAATVDRIFEQILGPLVEIEVPGDDDPVDDDRVVDDLPVAEPELEGDDRIVRGIKVSDLKAAIKAQAAEGYQSRAVHRRVGKPRSTVQRARKDVGL